MKQRLVGLLILSPQQAEASSKKVDQLQARLPGNCVDEQMRMAENRATRLAQLGLSADVHLLAGLIQRVRTQCEIFDMSDPVDSTQDIPTATGLESDIEFLEERKVEGLSERRVPAPRQAGSRWTVERTHSRMNDYGSCAALRISGASSSSSTCSCRAALIVLRQLIQQARLRYRWPTRPTSRRLK